MPSLIQGTPAAVSIASSSVSSTAATTTTAAMMSSAASLPPLSAELASALEGGGGGDKVRMSTSSAECTSLKVSPSGRVIVAGFTDGTLRLFPTIGLAKPPTKHPDQQQQRKARSLSTCSSSSPIPEKTLNGGSKRRVQASSHVAAQIVSKGVHTNLLMDVDVSPDGLWAFAGVLRGSMELVALHLGHLEQAMDEYEEGAAAAPSASGSSTTSCWSDWMDTLTVYKQVDAKLRGFGACTCLGDDRYLLLTGKAIKNIHIWSFTPPKSATDAPVWTQLYDTQTNGNTIKWLSFHVNPTTGALSALSKSDGQKLRVWDLRREQNDSNADTREDDIRPSRPPFVDVANTEGMLGVAGGYAICGGASESMYHQVGIVNLNDVGDLQSPYNHTELALPSSSSSAEANGAATVAAAAGPTADAGAAASIQPRRRQQRGDLKSVERVAGMEGQAILELSDGNLVQFQSKLGQGLPVLTMLGKLLPTGFSRQLCVARVASCGLAIAATAVFNPAKGRGVIRLWPMESIERRLQHPYQGQWGYRGVPTVPKPVRGKAKRSPALKSEEVKVPAPLIDDPPTSVVKALVPPPAATSTQKENRPQASVDVSIVTPRYGETGDPNSISAASRSLSANRPYRVSMEPVKLDETIDRTPCAKPQGANAKLQAGKRSHSDGSLDERRRRGSNASDGSARAKKRKPDDGKALRRTSFSAAAVRARDASTPPALNHPPPLRVEKQTETLAVDPVEGRRKAGPTGPDVMAPRGSLGKDTYSTVPGVRLSCAPAPSGGFKSPTRRDKKRNNKSEVPTNAWIVSECKQRKSLLEQLIRDCPIHSSPLLQADFPSRVPASLIERHAQQRQKLLLSQVASYDRLIKSVLNHAVRTLDLILRSPVASSLNDARETWAEIILSYQEMEEGRAHHHALEMDGLLSRQAWECLSSSNASSAPATAEEEVGVTLRSDVQSILHQLKECIPQNLEGP